MSEDVDQMRPTAQEEFQRHQREKNMGTESRQEREKYMVTHVQKENLHFY